MEFVLDCSFAMCWNYRDQADTETNQAYLTLRDERTVARVPAMFFLEVLNALLMGERRGLCSPDDSLPFLSNLRHLPIQVEPPVMEQELLATRDLARQHQLTAYDAAYLELAQRNGLPLATRDKALRGAAIRAGIPTDMVSFLSGS